MSDMNKNTEKKNVTKDTRTEEQKKIDAIVPKVIVEDTKKGIKLVNSPDTSRFLSEVKVLAAEKDKELRQHALKQAMDMKKAYVERAGKSGYDEFGISVSSKAHFVVELLKNAPRGLPMKNAQNPDDSLCVQLTKRHKVNPTSGKAWSKTHYDAMNELHALGLIGLDTSVHPQRYFLLPDATKKSKNKK